MGFPDIKRYIMLDHLTGPDVPFRWLQAVDCPDLAFVITDPLLFYTSYSPRIDDQDLKELNITSQEDRGIVVIVTIPDGAPENMTVNLQGPIVVNLKTKEAKQVVLSDDGYPVRYP